MFCDLELSSKSECHVAWCIGRKTLFFVQKISKMKKLLQISWNLGWTFSIKCHIGIKRLQPISEVDHAPFASFAFLMPSLILPLNSLFVPCKLYSLPCNEKPCVSKMSCPCRRCLVVSLSGCWLSWAKTLDQRWSLAQVKWTPPSSFGQRGDSPECFVTP